MPAAARVTDIGGCPMSDGPKPHTMTAIVDGYATVLIGGLPAAVAGSACLCLSPKPATIVGGSGTVRIGGKPAARAGDRTDHAGTIRTGAANVTIG